MPPPPVYVIQDEEVINAFAAGWQLEGSIVAFSAGAMKYLTRDRTMLAIRLAKQPGRGADCRY